jgi:hypothetical protein
VHTRDTSSRSLWHSSRSGEMADALVLGTSTYGVEVQVLSPALIAALLCGPRRSGEIGRRTSLRGWRSKGRGGSSPPFDTTTRNTLVPRRGVEQR